MMKCLVPYLSSLKKVELDSSLTVFLQTAVEAWFKVFEIVSNGMFLAIKMHCTL